jgi:hypothetical protein
MRTIPFIVLAALVATAFVADAWAQTAAPPAPATSPTASAQTRKDPRDLDHDQRLSWDEYRKSMLDNFARLDANKDDVLESAELPKQPPPKPGQKVARAEFESGLRGSFDHHDANKDGFLSGDELPSRK